MKTCKWCDRELPESEYHRSKDRPDGLQDICKLCNKYRTMYALYRKKKDKLPQMVEDRKVRILLMELQLNGFAPKDAVTIAVHKTTQQFQKGK